MCKKVVRNDIFQNLQKNDTEVRLAKMLSGFEKQVAWRKQQFTKKLLRITICKNNPKQQNGFVWIGNLQILYIIDLEGQFAKFAKYCPEQQFARKLSRMKICKQIDQDQMRRWLGRKGRVKHFSIQFSRVRNFWPQKAPDLHILLRDSDSVFLFVCVKLKFLNLPVLEIIIYNISCVICNIEAVDESCLPHQSPAGWERCRAGRRSPRWPCPGQPRGSYKSRKHGELFTSVRSSPSIVVRELRGNPPNTKWL